MATISGSSYVQRYTDVGCNFSLTVTADTQSIAENYTNVKYSYSCTHTGTGWSGTARPNAGYLQVVINGSTVVNVAAPLNTSSYNDGANIASGGGTAKVYHNDDGTKTFSYSISMVTGTDQNNYQCVWVASSNSGSMTLNTIPRATQPSMSASSVAIGNTITINTPRAASAFTHSLWYQVNGGAWQSIATGVSTSYSWTVPVGLASSVPNGTSIGVTVICRTYNGSTSLGDKYASFTAYVPDSVVPSMGNPTASRVDNGVPSSWGVYVKGYSKVTIEMTSVSGSYGSTIKSYSITGPNLSSSSSSATSGVLVSAGTNTYTCTITDSRGRTASKTVSISVVDYSQPSISVSASRCNSDGTVSSSGTYLLVTATYSIASVSSKNSVSSRSVSCNGASDTSFSSGSAFVLGANCAINTSYTLTASVKDALNNTASASITIPTASRIMNVRANKSGIAFGKFAESDNLVDFGWPIHGIIADHYLDRRASANVQFGDGGIRFFKATSSMTTGKPPHDGTIIHAAWDNNDGYDHQLCIGNSSESSSGLFFRAQHEGTWGAWRTILDSSNYTNYSPSNSTFNSLKDTVDSLSTNKLARYSPNGYEPIRYFAGDKNGDNMVVGLGGSIVIGSGESAQKCIDQWGTSIQNAESLDLSSDTYVSIHTNLQNGYSAKRTFDFKADGRLTGALYGYQYVEGCGVSLLTDCATYMEVRSDHGAKGITWWDSDASLKKNIKNTEVRYALEKISQLKHIEFDWKENDSHVDLGYVADDVEKILPCLVFDVAQYDEDGKPNGEVIKNIDYRTMIPLITMGVQELIEERDLLWTFDEEAANCIIKLREEVDSLKTTVNELKAEIESLKKAISV